MARLMIDIEGEQLSQQERQWLLNPLVAGVILFARSCRQAQATIALCAEIRSLRPDIILAVDQEGGRVQRCKDQVSLLPAMGRLVQQVAAEQLPSVLTELGWLMAAEMIALGFDISFAPVLDLDFGRSEVIGDRAFGQTASQVSQYAGAWIAGMQQAGMAATGKHFPGHGYVIADSHFEAPVDERELSQIEAQDLQPFAQLMPVLRGIMPAHVCYPKVDAQVAGFSTYWLQQVLRQRLQFDGIIFSDDLAMAGAAVVGGYPERARAATLAGCDLLLVCNAPAAVAELLEVMSLTEQQAHESTDFSQRLARLQAAKRWTLPQLQQDARAQSIRQWLHDFS